MRRRRGDLRPDIRFARRLRAALAAFFAGLLLALCCFDFVGGLVLRFSVATLIPPGVGYG